jgi:hypothetical protein
MTKSDDGCKISLGMESANLRERTQFYADRNQIETAVFFAGHQIEFLFCFQFLRHALPQSV